MTLMREAPKASHQKVFLNHFAAVVEIPEQPVIYIRLLKAFSKIKMLFHQGKVLTLFNIMNCFFQVNVD